MMWDWNDSWSHGYGGGGWLMLFGMILVTVVVVLLVVYLVRLLSGAGVGSVGAQTAALPPQTAPLAGPPPESARDILKRRYAAGEIERAEYLEKLADLST
jgi:uncharacterized membrane protein